MTNVTTTWTGPRAAYGIDPQNGLTVCVRGVRIRGRTRFRRVELSDRTVRADLERGAMLASALSPRESLLRWIEAPFAAPAKARRVLPTLLDIQLPFALEQCICVFPRVVATGEGTTRALAVAVRHADLQRNLSRLAELDLDPPIVDSEGLALWTQWIREAPPPEPHRRGLTVLVNLRGEQSVLVIGRGNGLLAVHAVGEDPSQIGRLLSAQSGSEPGTVDWFWCGSPAENEGRLCAVRDELLRSWPGSSTVLDRPAEFLARALVTRALEPGPLRCNLRQEPFRHPRFERVARRRSAATAVLCMVCGISLLFASTAVDRAFRRRERALDNAFGARVNELAGFPVAAKGRDALRTVRVRLDARREVLRPVFEALETVRTVELSTVLKLSADAGLRLHRVVVDDARVEVHGLGPDWNAVSELHARLEDWGFAVRLERDAALPDGSVPFALAGSRP